MELSQEKIDELIAKELAGEAGPEESKLLDTWKNASPENLRAYTDSLELFKQIDAVTADVDVNVEAAWQKMNHRIGQPGETKVVSLFSRKTILRAAASIILLAVMSIVLYSVWDVTEPVEMRITAVNQVVEKKLPDGSEVVLNKNSQMEFVSHKEKREVKLKGEAFFNVVHNEKHPFVISVDDIFIEDIGTAFNVKAIPGSELVEVMVEEGEVRFYTTELKGLTLKKGQSGFYNRTNRQFRLVDEVSNVNVASYKTKNFRFKASPLGEVIGQLSEVYGLEIQLENESLKNCLVSVSFVNENPEVIMEILAETLNLELVHSGNVYILKGEACQ